MKNKVFNILFFMVSLGVLFGVFKYFMSTEANETVIYAYKYQGKSDYYNCYSYKKDLQSKNQNILYTYFMVPKDTQFLLKCQAQCKEGKIDMKIVDQKGKEVFDLAESNVSIQKSIPLKQGMYHIALREDGLESVNYRLEGELMN